MGNTSKKRWHEWCQRNERLIRATGVPLPPMQEKEFVYYLMHGDHPEYPWLNCKKLSVQEKANLKTLVIDYIREFSNPGLMLFSPREDDELVRKASETD